LCAPRPDDVVCAYALPEFFAVGVWYRSFDQLDDAEVIRLLGENRRAVSGASSEAAGRI
jgi:predicted phosphoribosyltransferase